MFRDLNDSTSPSNFDTDLCIVGSGAVGLALAEEFFGGSKSVLVVEAGTTHQEPEALEEFCRCEVTGLPHAGCQGGRYLAYGGTTVRWGGQTLPMDELDFEERSWIQGSGWPIGPAEIDPYISRADRSVGVEDLAYSTNWFERYRLPELQQTEGLRFLFSKWSPRPNLGVEKEARLRASQNVTVLTSAHVTDIRLHSDLSTVELIEIRSPEGGAGIIRARKFVLCAGGIENARLLLASNRQIPSGIGNQHGMVGRFFQDHPATVAAHFRDAAQYHRLQKYFHYRFLNGTRFLPRICLTAEEQRRAELLNACALVRFQVNDEHPFFAVKQFYRNLRRRSLSKVDARRALNALMQAPALASSAYYYLVERRVVIVGCRPELFISVEQPPAWDSRIGLSRECNRLGVPLAEVHWTFDDRVPQTLIYFARKLKTFFERNGFGEVELPSWVSGGDCSHRENFQDIYHHMGSTRMSADPAFGVVDRNLRMWNVSNLYICGCSVFPTGGHSNPTLTAIALTKRLADQFKLDSVEKQL